MFAVLPNISQDSLQLGDADEKICGVMGCTIVGPTNHVLLLEIFFSLGFWEPSLC